MSRLKSIVRYLRLCPPPWWRTVIRPWLLRPAFFVQRRQRLFSGLSVVISSNVDTDMFRRPGEVGLYFLTPMNPSSFSRLYLKHFDLFAVSVRVTMAFFHSFVYRCNGRIFRLALTLTVFTFGHFDAKYFLDGLLDFRLICPLSTSKTYFLISSNPCSAP